MNEQSFRGEELALALRDTGLAAVDIAAACGVTEDTAQRWLAGEVLRRPHRNQREKISALLERAPAGVAA